MLIETPSKVSLHVDAKGCGTPILFTHGFTGGARNWRAAVTALANENHQCITYDVLGHGKSDAPADVNRYALEALVQDMADILDYFEIETTHLVGLSMGSALSLAFALKFPYRVNSLVLASFPNQDPGMGGVSTYAAAFAEAILKDGLAEAGARFVWGEDSFLSSRDASLVRMGYLTHQEIGLANLLAGFFAKMPSLQSLEGALKQLRVPTLILAGEKDGPSVTASKQLVNLMPNAQCQVIPNGGHLVNLDSKEKFNQSILDFYRQLTP